MTAIRSDTAQDVDVYMTRAAAVMPSSLSMENRTVDAVLSTEGVVEAFDLRTRSNVTEVLLSNGATWSQRTPAVDSHDTTTIRAMVGSMISIRKENEQIVGTIRFARGERGQMALDLINDGHLTDVSIGYRVRQADVIPPFTTRTVMGREFRSGATPLRVVSRYWIKEVSLTPVGADQDAKIRADESIKERSDMELNEVQEGAQATATAATPVDTSVRSAVNTTSVAVGATTTPATVAAPADATRSDSNAIHELAVRQERERISAIRSLASDDTPETLVTQAINSGWSVERSGTEFLRHLSAGRSTPVNRAPAQHNHSSDDATRELLSAGFALRTGNFDTNFAAMPEGRRQVQERLANQGDQYRRFSMLRLAEECARMERLKDPLTGSDPVTDEGYIRAAVSGSNLTYVFTTSVQARLIAGYTSAADSTGWCMEEDVPNFKTNDLITPGRMTSLKRLPRGQTAPHAKIDDTREQYKIARYANQFVIDEQDMIDENLGFFSQIPFNLGLEAAQLRPDLVYALLLANPTMADTGALFNTTAVTTAGGHANKGTGGGTALSSSALKAAITAMVKQYWTDPAGKVKRINVRPQYLIVPPDLEFTARELINSSQIVIAGTAGSVTERGNINTLAGALQIISEARLDATGVTDPASDTSYTGSATNWFLAADSSRTIRVGYRTGTGRRPQVRSFQLTQGQWGMGWDINMDIGVKAVDFRGLYYAAGA